MSNLAYPVMGSTTPNRRDPLATDFVRLGDEHLHKEIVDATKRRRDLTISKMGGGAI